MRRGLSGPLHHLLGVALIVAGLFALGSRAAVGDTAVHYVAGWNLVAGPAGTVLPVDGPLYTLQPNDDAYEIEPANAGTLAGQGYWAYFSADASVILSPVAADSFQADSFQMDAPAGAWFLVGNPGTELMRLSGADAAYAYDPTNGYTPVDLLPPGRGAFVYVAAGGTITLSPAADTILPVPIVSSAVAASPGSTPIAAAPTMAATGSVQVLADGFGQSRPGSPVGVGVLVRNNSSMAQAQVPISLTVYGRDGAIIATGDLTLRLLAAGQTTGAVKRLSVLTSTAEATRISALAGAGRPAGDPLAGSVSFSQIALAPGRNGLEASAALTSSFITDLMNLHIHALVYDAAGSIIGGGVITRRLAPAGSTIGVLIPVDVSGAPARVEFYAELP